MKNFARPFSSDPATTIHHRHVHVHGRELQLNAARAPDYLLDAGKTLKPFFGLVGNLAVRPIKRDVRFHYRIKIEAVFAVAGYDRVLVATDPCAYILLCPSIM